jgi:hypothetical protein
VESLGGAPEVQLFGDDDNGAQMSQLHGSSSPSRWPVDCGPPTRPPARAAAGAQRRPR